MTVDGNPPRGRIDSRVLDTYAPEECMGCDRPNGVGRGTTMFVCPDPDETKFSIETFQALKCIECGTIQHVPAGGVRR